MRLAIFDYNGTIFPQETLRFLLEEWKNQGYSRLRYYKIYLSVFPLYLRYKAGFNFSLSKEEMERRAVEKFSWIFKGMKNDEIQEFFTTAEMTARNYYNREIIRELKIVKTKNYHTVLLSGAFSCLLQQAADGLGIETVIGSRLGLANHRYNPGTGMEIISGSNKLARLK
ncbi:MAG: HAD family hydrolase, partial [Halanaerobiales bacterium]